MKAWIRKTWSVLWPLVLLALLCGIFFWDVLWMPSDRAIAGNDLTHMFSHWLTFAGSSIRQGQLPLWNPYLFSGIPFAANPQPALFYPPTWLALLLPVPKAMGLIIVLHLWLAGAGTLAWLRSEGASTRGALFGAVTLAFSGYFFVRVQAGHLGVISTGAWLPFILWAYRRAVERRSWKLALLGGLPVGLAILAGHTASFIYVALGLAAYALFYAWKGWQSECRLGGVVVPLAWAGLMGVAGLALAAVQVLPTVGLVVHSARQADPSYAFAARFSWPPGYLVTLLVPNFFGEPVNTGYWGDGIYDELIFYVGVLPLVLALLALRLRHRLKPFLLALGLGALLLALGEYGGLHRLFYRFVPLFGMGRAPARAGFLFTLAVAALAGLMVSTLESSGWKKRVRLLRPVGGSVIRPVVGGAVALIVAGFAAFAWGRELNPSAGRLFHLANQTALFLLFFLLAVALLGWWRRRLPHRIELGFLALLLVLLDLWTFGNGIVEPVAVSSSDYWRVVAQAVEDPSSTRVLPWGLNAVEHNGGMAFGLRSVFGYDPLTLQRFETFVSSRPDPLARTYDLLNAGVLVTDAPQPYPDEPGSPQVILQQDGVWVYRRPDPLPRAWVVPQVEVLDGPATLARIHQPDFDPRTTALVEEPLTCLGAGEPGEVEIVDYENRRIEARVQGGGGVLIFSEVDYPGWRAAVDGKPAPIVRADYLLRAVCVPAGSRRVELVYDPPLLKAGSIITALTAVLITGCAVWMVQERRGRFREVGRDGLL